MIKASKLKARHMTSDMKYYIVPMIFVTVFGLIGIAAVSAMAR